jgi:ActR/RegA family two-component response regulator
MITIDQARLNRFLEERGYAKETIHQYSEAIRQVNREGLTVDAIYLKYGNYSCYLRHKLRMAVRMLDEFKNWCKNDFD